MVKIVISMQDGKVNAVVANTAVEVIVRRPLVAQDFTFDHGELVETGADGEQYAMYRCKPWINDKGVEYMFADMANAEAKAGT